MADIIGSNAATSITGTNNAAVGTVPSVLGAETVTPTTAIPTVSTTPTVTAVTPTVTAVPAVTTGIPSVLQTTPTTGVVATAGATTGIPEGWKAEDYQSN